MTARNISVFVALIVFAPDAMAQVPLEKPGSLRGQPARSSVPMKPASSNPCSEHGAGFVRLEGSNTCVKIGGAVSIGAGVAR